MKIGYALSQVKFIATGITEMLIRSVDHRQ